MLLNDKIRVLLANNEWSQAKLAELIHVSPDAVSSWVRGINNPTLDTVKQLCDIFFVPIQDMTDDDIEIPVYYKVAEYMPYSEMGKPENLRDSVHKIFDADLAHGGRLHRFKNAVGDECSAIYRGSAEEKWVYREQEASMIYFWNNSQWY